MTKMAYGENGYLDFAKLWKLLEKKNLKQYLKNTERGFPVEKAENVQSS